MNISPAIRRIPCLQRVLDRSVAKLRELVTAAVRSVEGWSAATLLDLEPRLHLEISRSCIDPIIGHLIQVAQESAEVECLAARLAASREHARLQRRDEKVSLRLLGGSQCQLTTPYYLRRPPGGSGGCRGAEGNGFYPKLEAMGIYFRVTPAVASEIARNLAMAPFDEALSTLEARGLAVNRKVACRIAQAVAKRGLERRERLFQSVEDGERGEAAEGRRLVIGADGGRLRTRVTRQVGRKRRSGRRGFDGVCREPKVLVIYEIDKRGRRLRKGLLRYDATMQDANGLFKLLVAYLGSLGADKAAEWIVVGDGAGWIWDRVPALIEALGFDHARVTEVVDFYHAVQRLNAIV